MIDNSSHIKIIISGGGTGGHIFPAIAIANAIKKLAPDAEILFVGAENRMEMEKVPAAGYRIVGLPIEGLNRKKPLKNIMVAYKLLKSLRKASVIINEFRPHAVLGVGGYASGPLLWVASQKHIPVYIQEQNSYAGITNKLLAKKAHKIFVAYHGMERFFPKNKILLTGNPIRSGFENVNQLRDEAIRSLGIHPNKKTILCLGGSLGAKSINDSILQQIDWFSNQSDVQLIWQCGKLYFNRIQSILAQKTVENIYLFDFITRMDYVYAAADVIISRAGAGTISELCVVGKPVILVPSPNVAEDHQTKNAMAMVSKQAALMIPDNQTYDKLLYEAVNLLQNEQLCNILAHNISKLAMPGSAEKIAEVLLNEINQNR